ncbi:MAG: MFS transporter [Candidatus Lokiarchaeota archaeon]|nr:MFS transporter [Candidatus Lokiarchaeota archaeon]
MAQTSPSAPGEASIKVNIKQTVFIGFGFFSAMIAWTFYNFKIPIILNGIKLSSGVFTRVGLLGTEPAMEILGGFLMTLDNIIAILLQPYFGRISDRMESKWGRRTPFVILGVPTAVICLVLLPFTTLFGDAVTITVLFIAIIFVFNLAMAFYRPPVMSLMPDKTPAQVRSSSNSYISLMGGFGFVVGMLVPYLVSLVPGTKPVEAVGGDFASQNYFLQDLWGFLLTGAFMFVCLVVFLKKVRETPTGEKFFHVGAVPIEVDVFTQEVRPRGNAKDDQKAGKAGFFDEWRDIVKDEDKSAFWILITVFAYLFGFNAIEYSFGRYATSYLELEEGTASLLLAIMPAVLILFAIPAGYWAEKYGRLKIMKVGIVVMMAMTVGLIITMPMLKRQIPLTTIELVPAIILLCIAGMGYGLTHINALPVVWQLAPRNKIGAYTGVYYMISALGAILSPVAMSSTYAVIAYAGGDQWLAFFPYFLCGLIVGLVLMFKVKRGDAEPLSADELRVLRGTYAGG